MFHKLILNVLFFVCMTSLWQTISSLYAIPEYIFPSPAIITLTLFEHKAYLLKHFAISVTEIVLGVLLGLFWAFLTALILDHKRGLQDIFMPYLIVFKNLPIFVLAPLLLIWFGHGIGPKAFLIGMSSYFPMAIGLMDGLKAYPQSYSDFLTIIGPTSWFRTLFYIRLPYAMPRFFTGFRLALMHAPISVIACDWIGSSSGLGYVMMLCYGRIDLPMMFACLFLLIGLSILFYHLAKSIDRFFSNKLHLNYI